ncbi:MAG: hypothetical protein RIT36_961 [Bacteroidota bacterium]
MICGNFCMGGLFFGNKGQQRHGQVVLHVLTRVLILELVELVGHLFGHFSHGLLIFGFYLQPVCSVAYRQVYRNQILHFLDIYIFYYHPFRISLKSEDGEKDLMLVSQ